MRCLRFISVTLSSLLAFPSCAAAKDGVIARFESPELVLINETQDAVYYAVFGREELTRIEWVTTCTEDNLLPGRGRVRMQFEGPLRRRGDEAVVFWWRECGDGATELESLSVPLR